MPRRCVAAFWRTLSPLAQATQDKARLSMGTASPQLSCTSHPTVLILQETSNQTLDSHQKPIGDQGWSLMGDPELVPQRTRLRGAAEPHQPLAFPNQSCCFKAPVQQGADESGELIPCLQGPHTSSSTEEDASGLSSPSAGDPCKHHLILR